MAQDNKTNENLNNTTPKDQPEIMVGIGEIAVCHNPKTLTSLGLGSCVGVALYDKENHIGGLAHVMLPESKEFRGEINKTRDIGSLTKYADIAIPQTIKEMEKLGANRKNIKAKIAGGAQMFPSLQNSEYINVGKRNIESVKKLLKEENIPIESEETGGCCGRSVRFDVTRQKLKIKTIKEEKEI